MMISERVLTKDDVLQQIGQGMRLRVGPNSADLVDGFPDRAGGARDMISVDLYLAQCVSLDLYLMTEHGEGSRGGWRDFAPNGDGYNYYCMIQ